MYTYVHTHIYIYVYARYMKIISHCLPSDPGGFGGLGPGAWIALSWCRCPTKWSAWCLGGAGRSSGESGATGGPFGGSDRVEAIGFR